MTHPPAGKMRRLVQTHASADALLGSLALALEAHTTGIAPFDDITMLAVRRIA